jgi:CheY-like chemotaxis protein
MSSTTVLIVDDIQEQRDIYTAILRHHGYRVVEARSGPEALELVRQHEPGLILLDMMMAGMDGLEVAEHLKRDEATAAIPIVALTVRGSADDQTQAQALGIDRYVIKPCTPGDMLAEVQRYLPHPSGAP